MTSFTISTVDISVNATREVDQAIQQEENGDDDENNEG
jgi:hypothetical protein